MNASIVKENDVAVIGSDLSFARQQTWNVRVIVWNVISELALLALMWRQSADKLP